jgi:FlaA1/EpsC-like NDP-sugar epimerase
MLNFIKSLSRAQKRLVMIAIDSVLIPLALLVAFHLQMSQAGAWVYFQAFVPTIPYLLVFAAGLSMWLGVSSVHLKQYDGNSIAMTAVFAGLVALTFYFFTLITDLHLAPAVLIVFGSTFFAMAVFSRLFLLQIVVAIYRSSTARCRVLIYGAGTTGMQLVSAFRSHEQIEPVAFVDDNAALQGMNVARLPVLSPVHIAEIVAEKNIDRVLLAMPSQSQPKQAQIARRLQNMGLEVQTLPSFSQLIGEEALVDKLQPVNPRSFLNRVEVADNLGAQVDAYCGKVVLISGAGGSIGSELCRQVLDCRPRRLILFELSEHALYMIHQELTQADTGVDIVPVLGSVTDGRQVRKILGEHDVNVILHAAAYKHVPMVEINPLAGLANNVLGTHTLAEEARRFGVERFTLISSDKAVRPPNVMGASKRLAELVITDLASRVPVGEGPRFAIVRFGNVLGSSGSVVPLFQEQ